MKRVAWVLLLLTILVSGGFAASDKWAWFVDVGAAADDFGRYLLQSGLQYRLRGDTWLQILYEYYPDPFYNDIDILLLDNVADRKVEVAGLALDLVRHWQITKKISLFMQGGAELLRFTGSGLIKNGETRRFTCFGFNLGSGLEYWTGKVIGWRLLGLSTQYLLGTKEVLGFAPACWIKVCSGLMLRF